MIGSLLGGIAKTVGSSILGGFLGRALRSTTGMKDYNYRRFQQNRQAYDFKYQQDKQAYDYYNRDAIERMYQESMGLGQQREATGYDNLAGARGAQAQAFDRIMGDGRSYVGEQAGQLLDQQLGQTASLASALPTGANTSRMASDIIRTQSDQAAQAIAQANVARIAEERQRQGMMVDAAGRMAGTDLSMIGLAGQQRMGGQQGLTNLSNMVTGVNIQREQDAQNLARFVSALNVQREQDALKEHLEGEKLRQQGIKQQNEITADITQDAGQAMMPFLTPGKKDTGGGTDRFLAGAAAATGKKLPAKRTQNLPDTPMA